MSREELNGKTNKELCEMAGLNYELFRKNQFDRSMLIEIILTPND